MTNFQSKNSLAFELNVLRRLKFKSVSIPYTSETKLSENLKRWNVRVVANDILQSNVIKAIAKIQNNHETLEETDLAAILKDAYVPRYKLHNSALKNFFSETDAWWFDNVRRNIENLEPFEKQAVAMAVGIAVGDYVFSFHGDALELRQPLSKVFEKIASSYFSIVKGNPSSLCCNKIPKEFIAENYTDLMFLRLPPASNLSFEETCGKSAWQEFWVRNEDTNFWNEIQTSQSGKLGAPIHSKTQYLQLLEDTLQTAAHIPAWAIAHTEDNFLTTQDLVEAISRVRRVDTIFTKDFSELTGKKAVVITA